MARNRPRQRPPSQEDYARIPDFIKSTLSPDSLFRLAETVREYDTIPKPGLGEEAYVGGMRITGTSSAFNTFSAYGYYSSSDIPLNVLDTMRRDSQVALGMSIVKYPITNLGFTVNCKEPVIKEFVRATLRPIWSTLLRNSLLSLDYGFTPFEKVWAMKRVDIDPGKNKRKIRNKRMIVLEKLKPLTPTTVSLQLDNLNNLIGVNQKNANGTTTHLNKQKSMVLTYQEEYGNYFGKARLVTAYEPWYWKIIATQFFLRWMERQAIPPYVGRYPKGQSTATNGTKYANSDLMFRVIKALSSYGNFTLPSDRDDGGNLKWDVEHIKQGDLQLTLDSIVENVFNVAILRGLLIPDEKALSSLSPDAAVKIFLSTLEDFVKVIETKINDEIVKPLVYWNFPKDMISNCELNIDDIDFQKRAEMRKLLSKMLDVSATFIKNLGGLPYEVMPDMNKILEILDIPGVKAANYLLPVIDSTGKEIKPDEKKQKKNRTDAKRGPDKGELTPGNLAKTGRDGNPRDTDRADDSAQE
jgi:hypothetical protein